MKLRLLGVIKLNICGVTVSQSKPDMGSHEDKTTVLCEILWGHELSGKASNGCPSYARPQVKICDAEQRIRFFSRPKSKENVSGLSRRGVVLCVAEKGGRYMAKKRANGEGNIRKRKDGRWEGRYTAGYDPDTGKRIIKNVLGKTQAEVKEKLAQTMESIKDLDVTRMDDYTVGTRLTSWYELYAKPNVRVSTAEYYRRSIELHVNPRIGDIKLTKLTGRNLQKLYQDLRKNGRLREEQKEKSPGLSASTVRGIHLMLHNAMDRAVKERLIPRNPTDDCIAPKLEKKEMKILPVEDMKAYLDEAQRRNVLPMFYLEQVSGLRKGELVALLWSDLDEENQTISVSKQATRDENGNIVITRPKTETSVRLVSIPRRAVELLQQEHRKHPDNPYMFPSTRTGEMYYPDSVVTLHKRILKSAGLSYINFHSLRHTFATAALQNGIDVKTVSSMLGHYDAGFTLRTYTHATRQKQEQAAEKMGDFMNQVM